MELLLFLVQAACIVGVAAIAVMFISKYYVLLIKYDVVRERLTKSLRDNGLLSEEIAEMECSRSHVVGLMDGLSKRCVKHRRNLEKAEAENMKLTARIDALEKNSKIRTKPWKDSIGRWRDPITGHCIKSPAMQSMEAQLRKEVLEAGL